MCLANIVPFEENIEDGVKYADLSDKEVDEIREKIIEAISYYIPRKYLTGENMECKHEYHPYCYEDGLIHCIYCGYPITSEQYMEMYKEGKVDIERSEK